MAGYAPTLTVLRAIETLLRDDERGRQKQTPVVMG